MKKLIVASIIILLVFLGGCTSNTGETTPESQTPGIPPDTKLVFDHNLVGKTLEEAIDILVENEVKYEVVEAYNETYEQDLVISQSIAPLSEINETSKMVLTISKGSEFVEVPNIVAMTRDEAIEILESKRLYHQSTEANSISVNEGLVISQDPLPGTPMKIGSTVTLDISLGPKKIQMINLLNHTEAYVISFFNDVDLTCEISYMQSNTVEEGRVISQSIPKEHYANESQTINIVVSTGKVEFTVQDYSGRSLGEVTSLLSGHCIVETRFEYNPELEDRVIIRQNIEPGNTITIDDKITLVVNDWDKKPVIFTDPSLDQMIRTEINKAAGILTYSDVKDIINLANYDVVHDKIRSLEGIENLTSLQSLTLIGESISDVTPLADLTELRFLNLSRNNIQDISSLSDLVNLEIFSLSNNRISDISIMSNMTRLKRVSLGYCPVSSISVLRDYKDLESLDIGNTNVSADEVREILSGFTRLNYLHLSGLDVESLDFLKCQNTMKYLTADSCGLSDIECLSDFEYLQGLKINNNTIEDITPLANLILLETLSIGFNDIKDLNPLENLAQINYLFIIDIRATDFSALTHLTKLRALYISDNIIENVEFLRPLAKLETMEIYSDIQDLTNYYEIIEEHKNRGCKVIEKPQ